MAVLHYPEVQVAWCCRDVQDRSHFPGTADCHSRDVRDRSHCREGWAGRAMVDPPAAAGAEEVAAGVADWVVGADSAGSEAVADVAAAADASNSFAGRTKADLRNNGPSNRRY
jgi:hypothetical protein